MIELEDDTTYDEIDGMRYGPTVPRRPVSNIIRKGHAPQFRNHGTGAGRVFVYLLDDRWTILCPICHYRETERLRETNGERLGFFVCPRCRNEAAGNRPLEVVWPGIDYMRKVKAIVAERPPANRHWEPGETLGMLVRDNLAHGCAIPAGVVVVP